MLKRVALEELCIAYAREKQYWLNLLQQNSFQALLGNHRKIRDQFVKDGYTSISGLQARHWKLALQDAVETWDKYWQALFVKLRAKIAKRPFSAPEKRYAYFLIKGYEQFAALMRGKTPDVSFELETKVRKKVAGYIRRQVKQLKGNAPKVRRKQLVKFDANCYSVFENKGRQYISLMSLKLGRRIILPLEGQTSITGNISLILGEEKAELHITQELKKKSKPIQSIQAVDFGYTEVMTDTYGNTYGKQFGNILTKRSNDLHQKMQRRSKLYSLKKKHYFSQKARSICKHNLGKKKFIRKQQAQVATLKCEINRAINKLIKTKQPTLLITEDLSHLFKYNKPPSVNRKLSSWLRGEIQNRVSFKALVEGFHHQPVNPAFGSQTCPLCDFVDSKNRLGDKFKCLHCRYEDASDKVAATNYAKRYDDQKITLYTPYREVKTILLDRFHRRLETEQSVTVPGRTLDIVEEMHPPFLP